MIREDDDFVFGLDIGTRNVVGTVGQLLDDGFHVIAQCNREHQTRAMLDGQIHDINRVGATVLDVKKDLEAQIEFPLKNVCIAAAGRVLRTVTTHVEFDYPEETVVSGEDIHNLHMMGVEKAGDDLRDDEKAKYKFYCVGYSTVRYYLNGEPFSSLEDHKAEKIGEDIIVTFLPEDVVDGLYTAVDKADLSVANLTLEPIAAINVAIPENFRMLNIALIDVGAGTSDICVTRDGSIIAYGMIPLAGDELTEVIVQEYLVDFAMAEKIKLDSTTLDEVTYEDIMGLSHTIKSEEVWNLLAPVRERMTTETAEKIKELNGGKTVSAAFVVGGGGKVHGYTESLAKKLDIVPERVALRGEEVMKTVTFEQGDIKKDPLLVTPIGICLNYYEQRNNFIMIHFNGEMMKLYDNGQLTVVDAAMQAGFTAEQLFPRRGTAVSYTVNGTQRMSRGTEGESAVITMNGVPCGMGTPLEFNCDVKLVPSTEGNSAVMTIAQLEEYTSSTVAFNVNNNRVVCPKFVEVNGTMQPGSYEIQDGDVIEFKNYYTVGQLAEFMDVTLDKNFEILVNNRAGNEESLVYENFTVDWTLTNPDLTLTNLDELPVEEPKRFEAENTEGFAGAENDSSDLSVASGDAADSSTADTAEAVASGPVTINVIVNGEAKTLSGKQEYMFIDIYDLIHFDVNEANGRLVVTKINGEDCTFVDAINDGDSVDIYWKERD